MTRYHYSVFVQKRTEEGLGSVSTRTVTRAEFVDMETREAVKQHVYGLLAEEDFTPKNVIALTIICAADF